MVPGHRRGAELRRVFEQPIAGEGGDGLGAAGVAAALHHRVQFVEQTLGQGNTETGQPVGLNDG